MIQEIGNVRYKQAIVPIDAATLDINTIDFRDASPDICFAIQGESKKIDSKKTSQM